jgi:itaconyl-CoA hydratase
VSTSEAAAATAPAVGGRPLSSYTSRGNYFEDFSVGQRIRHVRGKTVGEFDNQIVTNLVMNTAHSHFNEASMKSSPWGTRLVFGLVTGSMVIGLATQDCAENALAEVRLDGLRFVAPVFHGDTLYAYSEVLAAEASPDRPDAGLVTFRHYGTKVPADGGPEQLVFQGERTVLLKRASHWSTP